MICNIYLKGPYNAGPKSLLFLRVALIKAGVISTILDSAQFETGVIKAGV